MRLVLLERAFLRAPVSIPYPLPSFSCHLHLLLSPPSYPPPPSLPFLLPGDVQWKSSNGPGPHPYLASFTILERPEDPIPRSRSVGSAASNVPTRKNPPILEDVANTRVKTHSEGHDSGSDSGYADPIDAVREYYAAQGREVGNVVVTEPPYQTLEEIQQARLMQIQENVNTGGEDPTYSRPIDCLMGLSNPVKVTAVSSQQQLSVFPLAFRRTASPDAPISCARPVRKKHHHQHRLSHHLPLASSGSDDTLSSFSSPEPAEESSLLSGRRSNSLGCLLEPEDVGRGKAKGKSAPGPMEARHLRTRVSSESNLLTADYRSPDSSPVLGRRTTCPKTVSSRRNGTGQASFPDTSPPHCSPSHVPVPVRVTRLENGQAMLVSPSILDNQ